MTTTFADISQNFTGNILTLEPRVNQLCRFHGNHILIGMFF